MPETSKQRTYAGETGDERVGRRRAALIEAAIALVAVQGWNQLRIDRVCEAASLNKRYFYENFANLDALAAAVVEQLADEVLELVVADDLSTPTPLLVRGMVEKLVNRAATHPARTRVLFREAGSNETAAQARAAAVQRIIDILVMDARTVRATTDPTVDVAASILVHGSMRTMLDWLDGRIEATADQFIDQLVTVWLTVTAVTDGCEFPGVK
ncbi:TetR family transcriptional regulator [Nocardia sp. NPDC050713]|uniref:TetR/AcrR family transcriptional regulator n=1 Tax=Nocardia sp. NPDC050713 TaxID=3154511 RepID=UPI0033F03781